MPKNFFAVVSDETAQASRSRDAGVADGSAVAVFVGSDGLARAARGVERGRGAQTSQGGTTGHQRRVGRRLGGVEAQPRRDGGRQPTRYETEEGFDEVEGERARRASRICMI